MKNLNPALSSVENWLAGKGQEMVPSDEVLRRLENLSWAGILNGMIADIGVDEVRYLLRDPVNARPVQGQTE